MQNKWCSGFTKSLPLKCLSRKICMTFSKQMFLPGLSIRLFRTNFILSARLGMPLPTVGLPLWKRLKASCVKPTTLVVGFMLPPGRATCRIALSSRFHQKLAGTRLLSLRRRKVNFSGFRHCLMKSARRPKKPRWPSRLSRNQPRLLPPNSSLAKKRHGSDL
ncbi:hypothetical protein DSECCO2_555180 [anaerobic digester metagenome]